MIVTCGCGLYGGNVGRGVVGGGRVGGGGGGRVGGGGGGRVGGGCVGYVNGTGGFG